MKTYEFPVRPLAPKHQWGGGPLPEYRRWQILQKRYRPPTGGRSQVGVRWGPERVIRMEDAAMRLSCKPPYVPVTFADMARVAVDRYLDDLWASGAMDPPKRRKPCVIAEHDDARWCATCGLRWEDTGEESEAPECPRA